eukprot:CAMPEP_0174702878 /NCGR_PEP_ID=MMETSP1094-20130205/7025_1 /TAXON_ID=156173 /ORGANISM="Chrysochromulina brevifilum, Strain UTEX LB 985" /LENGTH=115 /DNA_ID=CAMNT_0015900729 /DNA_START=84 /DNA_END=432 /DNA_ORIENTATION=-
MRHLFTLGAKKCLVSRDTKSDVFLADELARIGLPDGGAAVALVEGTDGAKGGHDDYSKGDDATEDEDDERWPTGLLNHPLDHTLTCLTADGADEGKPQQMSPRELADGEVLDGAA